MLNFMKNYEKISNFMIFLAIYDKKSQIMKIMNFMTSGSPDI